MNGCYNREPLKETVWAQDGWHEGIADWGDGLKITRLPRMAELPAPLSKTCQYSLTTKDAKCDGCRWNQGGGE